MARPRLNPRQKNWLNSFKAKYPWYKVREIRADLDGDRIIVLEGIEQLPLPLIPEFANASAGYRLHTVKVKIRKYGDPRDTSEHSYTTVYPHSDLDKKTTISQTGQLSLPIPAFVLEVPQAINPVIVTWKPKQKLKPKHGIQLSLPVVGLEALVFELRQQKRSHLPPISSQELLEEKIPAWNQRYQEEIQLPQVLVDLLLAHSANDQEWQSAIDLYDIAGLAAAMRLVEGLPVLRQHFWTPVSTAADSAAVPVVAATKTTKVTVKAFS